MVYYFLNFETSSKTHSEPFIIRPLPQNEWGGQLFFKRVLKPNLTNFIPPSSGPSIGNTKAQVLLGKRGILKGHVVRLKVIFIILIFT